MLEIFSDFSSFIVKLIPRLGDVDDFFLWKREPHRAIWLVPVEKNRANVRYFLLTLSRFPWYSERRSAFKSGEAITLYPETEKRTVAATARFEMKGIQFLTSN